MRLSRIPIFIFLISAMGVSEGHGSSEKCRREIGRRSRSFVPQLGKLEPRIIPSFGVSGYQSITTYVSVLARVEDLQTGEPIVGAHTALTGSGNVFGRTGPNGFTDLHTQITQYGYGSGGSVGLNLYVEAPGYFTAQRSLGVSLNRSNASEDLLVRMAPVAPFVRGVFDRVLHQSLSPSEVQSYVATSQGKTPTTLAKEILTTPQGTQAVNDLFAKESGKRPRQVVLDLYQQLLPEQAHISGQQLVQAVSFYRNGRGKLPVVLSLLSSTAFLSVPH